MQAKNALWPGSPGPNDVIDILIARSFMAWAPTRSIHLLFHLPYRAMVRTCLLVSKRLADTVGSPSLPLVAWQNVFKFVRRGHFPIMHIPIRCTLINSGTASPNTPYKSERTDITEILCTA